MNITFFVGNGFDINIGLKTRYSDFYPYFVKHASEKNMIREWLTEDELQWADLEAELGQKLELVSGDNVDQFYTDKDELDLKLLEYLEKEQQQISVEGKEKEIAEEMARSLKNFSQTLPEADRNSIASTLTKCRGEDFQYCFVCFNYTSTLDQIVGITEKLKTSIDTHKNGSTVLQNKIGKLIHIHGTLDSEMILGVNDEEQINSTTLKSNEEFLDTFIKRRMNDSIGQQKVDHVKKMLKDSRIVCVFGMSIGSTDMMWWQELVRWLKSSDVNKLVIYQIGNEEELRRNLPSKTVRLKNDVKGKLLGYAGISRGNAEYSELAEQIFISFNAPIFDFKSILFQNENIIV